MININSNYNNPIQDDHCLVIIGSEIANLGRRSLTEKNCVADKQSKFNAE